MSVKRQNKMNSNLETKPVWTSEFQKAKSRIYKSLNEQTKTAIASNQNGHSASDVNRLAVAEADRICGIIR